MDTHNVEPRNAAVVGRCSASASADTTRTLPVGPERIGSALAPLLTAELATAVLGVSAEVEVEVEVEPGAACRHVSAQNASSRAGSGAWAWHVRAARWLRGCSDVSRDLVRGDCMGL
jgi:hypothetical protein